MTSPNFQAFASQSGNGRGPAPAAAPAPSFGPPPGAAPTAFVPGPAPVAAPAYVQQSAGGLAFGAGAFAGARPMSEAKDCAQGTYVFEVVKTENAKAQDTGALMWRVTLKVVHVYQGEQTKGSECTVVQFMSDDRQRSYAGAEMLAITQAAFGCTDPNQLKAGLAQLAPQSPDAWSDFSDALQVSTQQVNASFGPNPLAGKMLVGQVSKEPGTGKHQGKTFTRFSWAPVPA